MTDIPVVKIAGKDYPVPPLVPKQLKYVIPDLLQCMPAIVGCSAALRDGKPSPLKTENFDQLLRVVFWGVIWPNDVNRKDATKSAKLHDLEEMEISLEELMNAARVIQGQTGLFRPASPGEGDKVGEAP